MMRKLLVIFFVALLPFAGKAQTVFPFAAQPARDSVIADMRAQVERTAALPLARQHFSEWGGALWAMELMLYRPTGFDKKVPAHLTALPQASAGLQTAYLEMLYALYPGQFAQQLLTVWPRLKTDKAKAIALEYLAKANLWPPIPHTDAFYNSAYYPLYQQRWKSAKPQRPKLQYLLHKGFLPGQDVLVSVQSADRNRPGYLMVRRSNGQWLADAKGKPLRFVQLARSISNLPYYITNGNTPQGLFRITGTDTSENNWIGPTPNLQLVMPFEQAPVAFFGDTANARAQYAQLLGPLAKFAGLMESYEAGKIGRTEIIAHGTVIPPQFYKGQPYFPCTPSLGCLCSPESWDAKGLRTHSVQQQWMDVLVQHHIKAQWLVVAEVQGR
jgi:hypothetical protein